MFLLDEIDKLGHDFRGDPASALLEVLDPEQNHTFNDHYLEVDFDLSQVMFICTANTLYSIPPALADRMEIIRLPGYLETEKVQIAQQFLVPKQMHGRRARAERRLRSTSARCARSSPATRARPACGASSARSRALSQGGEAEGGGPAQRPRRDHRAQPRQFSGPTRYLDSEVEKTSRVGVANGLAWTETGGDLLTIEVSILPGKGELLLTGKLGDVMRESGQAALSLRALARRRSSGSTSGSTATSTSTCTFPEGAMPEGRSVGGITMAAALVSALTGVPTRTDVAMTGEITLRGTVLPIGGLNEKAVAARRAGIKTVLIPRANEKDLTEIPEDVRAELEFVCVENMDQVLELALDRPAPAVKPSRPDETSRHLRPLMSSRRGDETAVTRY